MSWWKPAHAGSRSLSVVLVNLGHHRIKLSVGFLKELEDGCGLVAAFLYRIGFPLFR